MLFDDSRIKIDEKKVDFKNYQTIEEAKQIAYDLFGFKELGVNYEDTQLRLYSVGFKVLKQTFKDHESDKLSEYGISMATPLFLETKLPDEVFETLDANMIALRYYLWTEGIKSLDEVDLTRHIIFVNKDSTMMDLQQDILVNMIENNRLKDGETLENIAIFKEKYNSGGIELQEVSSPDNHSSKLSTLNILEGCRLFVDFRVNPEENLTSWEKEFQQHALRYRISFNDPHKGPVDQWANDEYKSFESTYEHTLFMECNQTCQEMKERMSQVINVDIGEFRIMKSGIKYEEIKDLNLTLYDAGLFKSSKVFIELGKPSNPGNFTGTVLPNIKC